MSRITEDEDKRFHALVGMSLLKLETAKNRDKPHWHNLRYKELFKMLKVEVGELDLAMVQGSKKGMNTELDDIINIALFLKDKLWNGENNDN